MYVFYLSLGSIATKMIAVFPVFILCTLSLILLGLTIYVFLPFFLVLLMSHATVCAALLYTTYGLDVKGWMYACILFGNRIILDWVFGGVEWSGTHLVMWIHLSAACGISWSLCNILYVWLAFGDLSCSRNSKDKPLVSLSDLTDNAVNLIFGIPSTERLITYQLELNGTLLPTQYHINHSATLSKLQPNTLYQIRVLGIVDESPPTTMASICFKTLIYDPKSTFFHVKRQIQSLLTFDHLEALCQAQMEGNSGIEESQYMLMGCCEVELLEKFKCIRDKRLEIQWQIGDMENTTQNEELLMVKECENLKEHKRQFVCENVKVKAHLKSLETQKIKCMARKAELETKIKRHNEEIELLQSDLSLQQDKLVALSHQKDYQDIAKYQSEDTDPFINEEEMKDSVNSAKTAILVARQELIRQLDLIKQAQQTLKDRHREYNSKYCDDQKFKLNKNSLLAQKAALEARHAESCTFYIQLKCEVEALENELHNVTRSKMTLLEDIAQKRRDLVQGLAVSTPPPFRSSLSMSSLDSSTSLKDAANGELVEEPQLHQLLSLKARSFHHPHPSPFQYGISRTSSKSSSASRSSSVYNPFSPKDSFFRDFPFQSFSSTSNANFANNSASAFLSSAHNPSRADVNNPSAQYSTYGFPYNVIGDHHIRTNYSELGTNSFVPSPVFSREKKSNTYSE
jgi:hypothetical protein